MRRFLMMMLGILCLAAVSCSSKDSPGADHEPTPQDAASSDGAANNHRSPDALDPADSAVPKDTAGSTDSPDSGDISEKAPFPGAVWTLTGTQRLLRDAQPGDTLDISIAAARNESESFQIFVRADTPIDGVNVESGALLGPDGARIDESDIELFRAHQLNIDRASYRNDDFEPGWYPDALIPFNLPDTAHQDDTPRFVAVPFDLPAEQTHSFWADIHVPEDAAPGEYHGVFAISAGDYATNIPVTLTVWDFTLPRVSTLATHLNWSTNRMRAHYEARGLDTDGVDWNAVREQTSALLSAHRLNSEPPSLAPRRQEDGSWRTPSAQVDRMRDYVDKYHVNAVDLPLPTNIFDEPGADLLAWLQAWDAAIEALDRPEILFYTYLVDEPNDRAAYEKVREWGSAIVNANTRVKVLVTEQTTPQDNAWGDLYGAVDIWVPLFSLFDPAAAAARRAQGERIWAYTALAQGREPTPYWLMDFPLLN